MKINKTIFIDVNKLLSIKSKLNSLPISSEEILYLSSFLSHAINLEPVLTSFFELDNYNSLIPCLEKWRKFFSNIPGFNYAGTCYILDNDSSELLKQGIIMLLIFAPSLTYNSIASNNGFELRFYDSGIAKFWFPKFEDAEQHPELFNFIGTWKEAYYLLIETLKKGWPMEEFPEELKPLLKK